MRLTVGGVPIMRGVRGQKWENGAVSEVGTFPDGWVLVFYNGLSP